MGRIMEEIKESLRAIDRMMGNRDDEISDSCMKSAYMMKDGRVEWMTLAEAVKKGY